MGREQGGQGAEGPGVFGASLVSHRAQPLGVCAVPEEQAGT